MDICFFLARRFVRWKHRCRQWAWKLNMCVRHWWSRRHRTRKYFSFSLQLPRKLALSFLFDAIRVGLKQCFPTCFTPVPFRGFMLCSRTTYISYARWRRSKNFLTFYDVIITYWPMRGAITNSIKLGNISQGWWDAWNLFIFNAMAAFVYFPLAGRCVAYICSQRIESHAWAQQVGFVSSTL